MTNLPDIQQTYPEIAQYINRVGITNLKLPVYILQKDGSHQHTVADISCYIDLESDKKGINMSRIPIAINKFQKTNLTSSILQEIAEHIRIKTEAKTCQLIYKFPYFITKLAPVSKEPGMVHYNVVFNMIVSETEKKFTFSVDSICTTLCPCSKEISYANAHNQKCYINITVETIDWIWIEDIINIAEESSSCPIYSILKRTDEKFVTEKMYENPKFVEDVVRTAYIKLINNDKISSFIVEATADESIHMHSAFAKIELNNDEVNRIREGIKNE